MVAILNDFERSNIDEINIILRLYIRRFPSACSRMT